MKTIIKIPNVLCLLACFLTMPILAQTKATKVSQSIHVEDEVTIDLNTNYCNIEFDTWNKDIVEIEAFVESETLSQEELNKVAKDWNLDIDASQTLVTINTMGSGKNAWAYRIAGDDQEAVIAAIQELKFELAEIPEIQVEVPELPELPAMPILPEMPPLPPLPEGINRIQFDYEAYKRDGEVYLKEWSKAFEDQFGEEYQKEMEAWGEKFGKEWDEKYGKQMEEWSKKFEEKYGKEYEKRMEIIEQRYERQMEDHAKRLEGRQAQMEARREMHEKEREERERERAKLADERRVKIEKLMHQRSDSKVKKTIKIKIPKNAKVKLNVRHGELKLASVINNLNANLNYAKLVANSINGQNTSINASYSPVIVENWGLGELRLNYVKDARLNQVNRILLNSNSSNIQIGELVNQALIDGSFDVLEIKEINKGFSNINVVLENSEAIIMLPQTTYNLQFKGSKTLLKHPKNKAKSMVSSYSNGDLSSNQVIVVNAKFSDIEMQ